MQEVNVLSDNYTVNFWDDPKEEYVGNKHPYPCHPPHHDKIVINIYCCEGCRIYAREACDGIKVDVKCKDDHYNCCSCGDSE